MARDQRARVLCPGGALEHRLREVAGLRREGEQRPEERAPGRAAGRGRRARPRRRPWTRRARRSAPRTSSTARCGSGTSPARTAADEIRARVVRPDPQDEQRGSSRARRRGTPRGASDGTAGAACAEPDDEASSADVQGAEDGRDPRGQPIAGIRPRERADSDEDDPDGEEQQAAPARGSSSGPPRRARRPTARASPSDGEDRVAGRRASSAEDLARARGPRRRRRARRSRRRRDERRSRAAARGRPRDARWRSVAPARAAVSARSAGCGGRTRASAASNASGPKSGHRTSVEYELGVGRLPDQEVPQPLLAAGPDRPGPGRAGRPCRGRRRWPSRRSTPAATPLAARRRNASTSSVRPA